MLHILLLILKIVGIILAVILGIILLLLMVILFVPIRYDISAKCDGTIDSLKAKVKATWLLHLLQAEVLVKGKKLKWQIKAAWIKKTSGIVLGGQDEGTTEKSNEESKESIEVETAEETQKAEETVKDSQTVKETEKSIDEDSKEFIEEEQDDIESDSEKKTFIDKIKHTVNEFIQKKEKLTDFLTDKSHVRAFNKLKKEIFVLLKRLKPKKTDIQIKFGFEDPSVTGKVLGVISMFYPMFSETTEIIPDFENKVLKGRLNIKGRIRLCHIAMLAIKLLLCKDIRTSYKDIKNFKL